MATEPKRCGANRKDGQPCQAPALPESEYCFAHDPERKADRDEARRRGGQNSSKIIRLRGAVPPRLIPIFDRLESALQETHDGTLEPQRAQAMASLARAMTVVLTQGDLEQRIRRIEAGQAGKESDHGSTTAG